MALRILLGIFSISPLSAKWDPLVSIVALCDEFGTGFEKKSWMRNLCGRAEDGDSWLSEILHIAIMGIITQRKGLLG